MIRAGLGFLLAAWLVSMIGVALPSSLLSALSAILCFAAFAFIASFVDLEWRDGYKAGFKVGTGRAD